jgi:hypothetical protein
MAVKLSALRVSRPLAPQEDSWYSFLLEAELRHPWGVRAQLNVIIVLKINIFLNWMWLPSKRF